MPESFSFVSNSKPILNKKRQETLQQIGLLSDCKRGNTARKTNSIPLYSLFSCQL